MDTLHDRLAGLAEEAPTGGAPAAELWARGKRAHRLRVAALAATLVVGLVGTGIGVRLADAGGDHSRPEPAGPLGITLPIDFPAVAKLPDLGDTPGPLAAVWLAPAGGGAAEVVGLVAGTGEFGTLPIDWTWRYGSDWTEDPGLALSPDGSRIAYGPSTDALVVHDLVTGQTFSPTFDFVEFRPGGYMWIDATHLVGHSTEGSDISGWVWEPGTPPKPVNLGTYPGQPYLGYMEVYGGKDLVVGLQDPGSCGSPPLQDVSTVDPNQDLFYVPVLCDVLGVVGSETLLGHWNSRHSPGSSNDPEYANGAVVALDIHGADRPYANPALRDPGAVQALEDPDRRHVVVIAGAPRRVTFATDLIGEALDADGGAS